MNVDTDTQWAYWEGVKDFYQVSCASMFAMTGVHRIGRMLCCSPDLCMDPPSVTETEKNAHLGGLNAWSCGRCCLHAKSKNRPTKLQVWYWFWQQRILSHFLRNNMGQKCGRSSGRLFRIREKHEHRRLIAELPWLLMWCFKQLGSEFALNLPPVCRCLYFTAVLIGRRRRATFRGRSATRMGRKSPTRSSTTPACGSAR